MRTRPASVTVRGRPGTPSMVLLVAMVVATAMPMAMAMALTMGWAGPVLAADPTVTIVDFAFKPSTVTITAGQAVTWRNTSTTIHTVTADDGSFDSGQLSQNDQFANVFDTPGTYAYHCSIHPQMTGKVIVKAAAQTPTPSGPPPPTPPPGTLPPSFQPHVTPSPEATATPTVTPGASTAATSSPTPDDTVGSSGSIGQVALLLALATVIAAAIVLLLRRRRAR
jgi:plastocyanin